jgi:O-antigen ligase
VANWEAGLRTWRDHPFTGKGLGTLVAPTAHARAHFSMEHWGTEKMQDHRVRPMEAHNIFLNVLGQTGLLGLVSLVALLVFLGAGLLPREPGPDALARVALFAALVGAVLYHGQFGALEESRQFWWLFGLMLAVKDRAPDGASAPALAGARDGYQAA